MGRFITVSLKTENSMGVECGKVEVVCFMSVDLLLERRMGMEF